MRNKHKEKTTFMEENLEHYLEKHRMKCNTKKNYTKVSDCREKEKKSIQNLKTKSSKKGGNFQVIDGGYICFFTIIKR